MKRSTALGAQALDQEAEDVEALRVVTEDFVVNHLHW